jgi:hypothetical protein
MGQNSTVDRAIRDSVTTNSIVTIDGDADVRRELTSRCDNSVDTTGERGPLTEYWGRDDDGDDWRVHVEHTDSDEGPSARGAS